MKLKPVALFALLALAALAVMAARNPDRGNIGENPLACEPVLMFDVSGSTLFGPCHKHLSVYNNGRVSLAAFAPSGTPCNESKKIDVREVRALVAKLGGWADLSDDPTLVTDIPMTTVTVFQGLRGFTDAQAHSFSYWLPVGDYAEVQETVDQFLCQTFPGLPDERDAIPYQLMVDAFG